MSKQKHRILALILALAFTALPLSACVPKRESATTPPVAEAPPAPEVPETPVLPNEPTPEPEVPSEPPVTTPPVSEVKKADYLLIVANNLNIRTGAGTDYRSLGQAEKGTLMPVTGKFGNWYQTTYRGVTAYIHASYASSLSIKEESAKTERVIKEGYALLGTPYVYGAVRLHDGKGNFLKGFTVTKFDCSSLTQYMFFQGAGTLLDVTTRTQIKQGTPVSAGEIKRGDLLFFTNETRYDKVGIERVGHVAVYLGENYILHTASDYAKIEQISAKRWSFFLAARRMF